MMLKRKGGCKRVHFIMCKFKGWIYKGGHYDVEMKR